MDTDSRCKLELVGDLTKLLNVDICSFYSSEHANLDVWKIFIMAGNIVSGKRGVRGSS